MGTDYNTHLKGMTLTSGKVEEAVKGFLRCKDLDSEDKYLDTLGKDNRLASDIVLTF